ncbi:MAG: hypothetical protein WC372_08100 [Candidatus Neomarinimicrobiota bacterium]|jgi:hypothetical protein
MDPDACLTELLELAEELVQALNNSQRSELSASIIEDTAFDLADHVRNLDEWLKKGGFLPKRWQVADRG